MESKPSDKSNEKFFNIIKWFFTFSAIASIIIGTLCIYYNIARNNGLSTLGTLLLLGAWMILLFRISWKWTTKDNPKFQKSKKEWFKIKTIKAFFYSSFVICLISNFLLAEHWGKKRVQYILNTEPGIPTIATVIELKETHGRSGTHYYAVIEYDTKKEHITQEINNWNHLHFVGEKILVEYREKHPDIFEYYSKIQR